MDSLLVFYDLLFCDSFEKKRLLFKAILKRWAKVDFMTDIKSGIAHVVTFIVISAIKHCSAIN